MARKNKKTEMLEYYDELTPVLLIKDNDRYKDDVTVTLNGYNYVIKRGVSVRVPRKVAILLDQSREQQLAADRMINELMV